MTIQQNDCYIGIKVVEKYVGSEISRAGLGTALTGVGLITAVGVGQILDPILADHGLITQILFKALIERLAG